MLVEHRQWPTIIGGPLDMYDAMKYFPKHQAPPYKVPDLDGTGNRSRYDLTYLTCPGASVILMILRHESVTDSEAWARVWDTMVKMVVPKETP